MNDTDLAFSSITDVARLFRAGKLSPLELTELLLARIERLNPKLNAYITVTAELARAQAKKAGEEIGVAARSRKSRRDRGVLHGIPVCLKDNISTSGVRTTAGSRILSDFVPANDAAVVTRLKEAGAVLLGKTNLHEFAYGVTNNNPHYGAARNPWDQQQNSRRFEWRLRRGGGCGTLFREHRQRYRRLHSNTCRALRSCGFKAHASSRGCQRGDTVCPSAWIASGRWRALRRMPRYCFARLRRAREGSKRRRGGTSSARKLSGFRLGLPREFFFDVISSEAEKSFESNLRSLRKLGAKTKEVSIPLLNETEKAGNRIGWAEATSLSPAIRLVSEPRRRV